MRGPLSDGLSCEILLDRSLKSVAPRAGENIKDCRSCQPMPCQVTYSNKARLLNRLQSLEEFSNGFISQPMVNIRHPVIDFLLLGFTQTPRTEHLLRRLQYTTLVPAECRPFC
jgi:hypothetical protein